jgi:diguanylate cyclase (GGDEF)-like protein/PAS domain S-box-containing protein
MRKKILLIQNQPKDAEVILKALTNSADGPFQVEWVGTCSQGLERLTSEGTDNQKEGRIAAVLVDLVLPDIHGIEAFDALLSIAPHIPILIITALQDEATAKLAVQRGAQDYLFMNRLDDYLLPKTLRSMLERAAIADALYTEQERAQVTLNSIGDAVICCDILGKATYLNAVAELMTGWGLADASGRPLNEVLRIIDVTTRKVRQSPTTLSMLENKATGLAADSALIRRDGTELAIEDSAAPIHDRQGQVIGAVMVFRDVSSTRAMTQKMSYLAQHDSLTELPNRVLFGDRLSQALTHAWRSRKKLAVLFLDLDRFKHINDSLGHDVGDRLLQLVAQRLLACVRSSDTVSRQGGDEFVVLLDDVARVRDASVIADKILTALRAPYRIDQHELHVTASIGIVTHPDDGVDALTLMKHADVAMYSAKTSGRNNYRFFEPQMNVTAATRQSMESDLRHAIERKELVLHYQPKIDLQTGTVVGAEALLRWIHPVRGLVPPVEFIPIAEDCSYIVPIGRWVLTEGCRQAQAWKDAGLLPISISKNVSAVELRDNNFVSGVRTILTEAGLEPRYLELELTETALLQDSASTLKVLLAIKEMGAQLALDDFGTGYSSLSFLRRFPIDTVKIDRSFVRDIATDTDDGSIVGAVISMGKNMHMQVVAEGVETLEQLVYLKEHGCPQGQGYYFGAPMSAKDFEKFLGCGLAQLALMGSDTIITYVPRLSSFLGRPTPFEAARRWPSSSTRARNRLLPNAQPLWVQSRMTSRSLFGMAARNSRR